MRRSVLWHHDGWLLCAGSTPLEMCEGMQLRFALEAIMRRSVLWHHDGWLLCAGRTPLEMKSFCSGRSWVLSRLRDSCTGVPPQ